MSLDPKRAARRTSSSSRKTASPSIGASPGWEGKKELLMGWGRVTSCSEKEIPHASKGLGSVHCDGRVVVGGAMGARKERREQGEQARGARGQRRKAGRVHQDRDARAGREPMGSGLPNLAARGEGANEAARRAEDVGGKRIHARPRLLLERPAGGRGRDGHQDQ